MDRGTNLEKVPVKVILWYITSEKHQLLQQRLCMMHVPKYKTWVRKKNVTHEIKQSFTVCAPQVSDLTAIYCMSIVYLSSTGTNIDRRARVQRKR